MRSKCRRRKSFTDNVINTAQALIIGLDASAEITLFNQFAEESTAWMEEEIRGKNFFSQFIPDRGQQALKGAFDDMMEGKALFASEIETEMTIRSGELINIVWHTTVIRDPRTKLR